MVVYHQVADFITANALFSPHDKLLAAVSGGPDSLCMLDCLLHADYPLIIAHFDHQLREGSEKEAEQVRRLAASERCEFILGTGDAYGLDTSVSGLEAIARRARYRFLADSARQAGCRTIVTGHHADDQVETVLLHLLRGAGLEGLGGMHPVRILTDLFPEPWAEDVSLARPLLSTTREEIDEHCEARSLQPVLDPSNQDVGFTRNRIRHELIPLLESYNPNISAALRRTGDIMRAIDAWMQEELEKHREHVVELEGTVAHLDPAAFGHLPAALQMRLVKTVLEECGGAGDVDFEAVQRLRQALLGKRVPRVSLPGGLEAQQVDSSIRIAHKEHPPELDRYPQLDTEQRQVTAFGETPLSSDWHLVAQSLEVAPDMLDDVLELASASSILLDGDQLEDELLVRRWKHGDRFQPLGWEKGSQKVGDFFTNEGVPREAREHWPLLCCGNNVLWVVGLRRSERAKLRKTTQDAIFIQLARGSGGGE